MNYADYLARKKAVDIDTGIAQPGDMHLSLFGYQADIVRWALRRGRAAVFAGIGSEVYTAVKMGRKGLGIELKPSYFEQAKRNLADVHADMGGLFAGAA